MRKPIQLVLILTIVAAPFTSASAGTLVVANKSEATVSLVDTGTKEIRATLPTGNAPHEVDVSPNGRLALVGNFDLLIGDTLSNKGAITVGPVTTRMALSKAAACHGNSST